MQEGEASFSVEVLGFPLAPDQDVLVGSVSSFFGIAAEDARKLVQQAPIHVKRGAAPPDTQILVRQLLELGADVCVRNEQTGAEKTYRAADTTGPAAPSAVAAAEASAPARAPAAAAGPPRVAPPPVGGGPIDGIAPVSAASVLAAAMAARQRGEPMPRARPAEQAPAADAPAAPAPVVVTGDAPSDLGPKAQMVKCPACSRQTEKGEICSNCGWDSREKVRFCRKCKGEIEVVSKVPSSKKTWIGIGVVAGVAAIASFLFVSFFVAGAILAAYLAAMFFVTAFTLFYRCEKCAQAVDRDLQPTEKRRLLAERGKPLGAGVALLASAVVLPAIMSLDESTIEHSSFGIGWVFHPPVTHRDLGRELRNGNVAGKTRQIQIGRADQPFVGTTTYFAIHVAYQDFASEGKMDKDGLEAATKEVIASVFEGGAISKVQSGTGAQGSQAAIDASFSGTDHGTKVFGKLHSVAWSHDLEIVAVAAKSEAAADAIDLGAAAARLEIQTGNGR